VLHNRRSGPARPTAALVVGASAPRGPAAPRLDGERPRPDCVGGASVTRAPDRRCSPVVAPARAAPAATVRAVARGSIGRGSRSAGPLANSGPCQ